MFQVRTARRVPVWLLFLLCSATLMLYSIACFIDDNAFKLDGRVCYRPKPGEKQEPCLKGWKCNFSKGVCVKDGTPAPSEGSNEPVSKDSTKQEKTATETPPSPEVVNDAGTPDQSQPDQTKPDRGPVISCPYGSIKPEAAEECPLGSNGDCDQLVEKVTINSQLPQPVSGAVAVTNDNSYFTALGTSKPLYIYVIGGEQSAKVGTEVYFAKTTTKGVLAAWKKTSPLKKARKNAVAFYIDDHVYVGGGVGADGKVVKEFERAKVNKDGSLAAFQIAGIWQNARLNAGIAFAHGYFYLAGGTDASKKLSTKVERILLKPDRILSNTPETLKSLPEGRTGPMVSTRHFLYLLGPNGSRKSLITAIDTKGVIESWCETTVIPKQAKVFSALADSRRLFLYGFDSAGPLATKIFMSPLENGGNNQANPLGGQVGVWVCGSKSKKAVTVSARTGSAAVIVGEVLYVIGGKKGKLNQRFTEGWRLGYRKDATCDMDLDGRSNAQDFCPDVYQPDNSNSDLKDEGDACLHKKMVLVPAGPFQRGSTLKADEQPAKAIKMDAFYIDRTEVTNKEYAACVTAKKCTPPSQTKVGSIATYYGAKAYDNFPVVFVTWKQASDYCAWRGKKLPTEAQWEKAARGIEGRTYPWGNSLPNCKIANFQQCPKKLPVAVGSLVGGESLYGVKDLSGNAGEWVADNYAPNAYKTGKSENPTGPASGQAKVVRGGSYLTDSSTIRTSSRGFSDEKIATGDKGFRCAITLFAK